MLKLSVVIITYNEEINIARCLDSIHDVADEVIVIDSYSTDSTETICQQYDVRFIKHSWEGYSQTKNFGNQSASNDFILSLDADEALSSELIKSIQEIKQLSVVPLCSFNRLTNYCGQWIKHCDWYPDRKVRLFDRTINRWEGTIHESIKIHPDQRILHLKGNCLHYSYYSIQEHWVQSEKFATLSARDMFNQGKRISFLPLIYSPIAKFIKCYLLNLGFLDGYYGFIICKITAYGTYLKYAKLRVLQK